MSSLDARTLVELSRLLHDLRHREGLTLAELGREVG